MCVDDQMISLKEYSAKISANPEKAELRELKY